VVADLQMIPETTAMMIENLRTQINSLTIHIWPPYGIYYCANPPHPSVKVNTADFYGMPYYHYCSG
jgi:hypothetical protein